MNTSSISTNMAPEKRKTVTTTTHYARRGDKWAPIAKTVVEEEYDADPMVQQFYPSPPNQPYTPPYSPPYVYCGQDSFYQEPSPMGHNNGGLR